MIVDSILADLLCHLVVNVAHGIRQACGVCSEFDKVGDVRAVHMVKTILHAFKLHALEVCKNRPDLRFVFSKTRMNVGFFPQSTIRSGLSLLLAPHHVESIYNELQTTQLEKAISLQICQQASRLIVLLDSVMLGQMWKG